MVSFININLVSVNFGPQVSGIVLTGRGASAKPYRDGSAVPSDLPIPWRELQPKPDVFSLLQWRTRISEFAGRDAEMKALRDWVNTTPPITAKFITGEGGVGKTRLAAELAKELRKNRWAAGFPELHESNAYLAMKRGTLLIVDYPEEHPGGLEDFLAGLARLEEDGCSRLRVLFLSRREADEWRQLALDANADAMFDWTPVHLGPLKGEAAYSVFHSALERAAEAEDTVPPPVSMEVLEEWLEHAPENDRALFIVATAVHSARHPDTPIVDYKGRDVVTGLVERETARLRRIASGAGLPQESLSRLLAIAAISDGLDGEAIEHLAAKELRLGLPQPVDAIEKLEQTGWLVKGGVPAPKPDILAAALLVMVFGRAPRLAPEWLWASIGDDTAGALQRLGRLSHDAEVVLGLHEHRTSDWLADSVRDKIDRCQYIGPTLGIERLTPGLAPLQVAVWRTLAQAASDEAEKALLLNNLSVALSELGDREGALAASREAVEIRRRLAAANPARFEPDLAMSLNNLSSDLSEAGDSEGALAASREAVEIYRRLAEANPARFEPELAVSLNNLSSDLSEAGDAQGALATIREAVDIRRRLAKANPARFEPDLAMSLNNLSNRLSDTGDQKGALAAVRESVDIRRRLAAVNPARFEPDLAGSLNNLSGRLSEAGDSEGALAAVREAVEIRRRLAAANPARFEPESAMSLNNLSNRLSEAGDSEGALAAVRESVDIYRRLAAANPARFEPGLASSLNNLSNRLSETGDLEGALAAIREAVDIYRRLAAANPARFEPDLAMSLDTLSKPLSDTSDREGALAAIREAVELIRPYASQYPQSIYARHHETMERNLHRLSS